MTTERDWATQAAIETMKDLSKRSGMGFIAQIDFDTGNEIAGDIAAIIRKHAPSPAPDAVGALVEWLADEGNILYYGYDSRYAESEKICICCKAYVTERQGLKTPVTHKPDCIHLEAKALAAALERVAKEER